jgi:N-acetylglucosamine-6-phosphate deacetylase
MTIAPEIAGIRGPGGVIDALAANGAIPSFGHTDASAEQVDEALAQARSALAAPGARSGRPTATHLFNGMRPLHHRDPGPIASCLAAAGRGELVVELIADGTHLAAGTVRAVFDLVGAGAIALVTDAMAAAGMPDGSYDLGPVRVRVGGGVARLADGDAIAGGTAHLLDVVRCVTAAGIPLERAVRAASGTPAIVLGRRDLGALEAGRRADVVVVDADLAPLRVLRAGEWVA